mgnify:CR=1 FL=1
MSNHKSLRRRQGAVLIEFALVVMMLVVLVFGITELGRALYQWNTLTKAAEVGARYLTRSYGGLDPLTCSPRTGWDARVDEAENLVVYGAPIPSDGAIPRLPGLTTDMVEIEEPEQVSISSGGGVIQACVIKIAVTEVPFDSVVISDLLGFANIKLSAYAEERYIGE